MYKEHMHALSMYIGWYLRILDWPGRHHSAASGGIQGTPGHAVPVAGKRRRCKCGEL